MTVLKVLELLNEMDADRRKAVGDAIRGRVRDAINQEVIDKLIEAVEAASAAGVTDEEIEDYVRDTLKKRARARQLANALKYRDGQASPHSVSSGKSS